MSPAFPRLVLRLPRTQSPTVPFVTASALAHAVAVVALFVVPTLRGPSVLPEDTLVVDLVGVPPRGDSPAPSAPANAPPEPSSEPRGAHVETRPVEPAAEPDETPEREPAAEEPPAPVPVPDPDEPAAAAASSATASQATSEPLGGAAGPATPGSSVTSIDLGTLEHAWYRDSVIAALQGQWVRPVLEGTGRTLEVAVSFDILRDGTVRDARITRASGVASLDRSALRAVTDASPLPPLPPAWGESAVPAKFLFRWRPAGG